MKKDRTIIHTALAILAWVLLFVLILLAALLSFWVLLGLALLHGAQWLGVGALVVLSVAITGFAWLIARYFASARTVMIVAGGLFAVLFVAELAWAVVSPDKALYLAREMAWSAATVWDYQKYPQRLINNAPVASVLPANPAPQLFQTIEYTSHGQTVQADFDKFLADNHTVAFIVLKDGVILYEKYFNGYQRDSIVPSFSMAKSFISALVGIAIDEGALASLDDPITRYLPELQGRGLDDVTMRHLISMSSGIRCTRPEDQLLSIWPFNDKQMAYSYPNLRDLALSARPGGAQPGTRFDYCDYNPLLLGLALERATGRSLSQYLSEKIWQPLGMEYPASWDLDSQSSGFEKTEIGINGRAIDFAKFGQLFLDQGQWNGRQVIPKGWIIESTAPVADDPRPYSPSGAAAWKADHGYAKFLWWGKLQPDGSYDYMAWGAQGEFIYVSPATRTVVVRFGIDEGQVNSWAEVFQKVINKVNQ